MAAREDLLFTAQKAGVAASRARRLCMTVNAQANAKAKWLLEHQAKLDAEPGKKIEKAHIEIERLGAL